MMGIYLRRFCLDMNDEDFICSEERVRQVALWSLFRCDVCWVVLCL